jgi:3-methyladenine DNA glycosylase AlkC
MEFYIRPFLNQWPDETLARLRVWAEDDNYHVRRLVSEGTRPKLPWAQGITLTHAQTLPLLDTLYGDDTRYVTRSVANHLNDVSKSEPGMVLSRLRDWEQAGQQVEKELDWLTRHALRGLIKAGHPEAMLHLGYDGSVPVTAEVALASTRVAIGQALDFSAQLTAETELPVLVDYRLILHRPGRAPGQKVFKLKQARIAAGQSLELRKTHKLKANATTFQLYPGPHELVLQVNGVDRARADFTIV